MPVLRNPRHEAFAQARAKGLSLDKSHGIAGYKVNHRNARTLTLKETIANRIDEILNERNNIERKAVARAVKQLSISKTRVLEEFAWVAFASAEQYLEHHEGRASWKKWTDLSPPQMAAVERVKVDEKTGDVLYRLPSLAAKLEALGKVGTELGMFINRQDNRHSFEKRFSDLPEDERRVVAEDLLARAREALERQRTIEAEVEEVGGDAEP